MTWPGRGVELLALGRADPQRARDVVLEVRRLAHSVPAIGLHVGRPAPAGLEGEPADLGAADAQQVDPAVRERRGSRSGVAKS